jgi:hypothetical protein
VGGFSEAALIEGDGGFQVRFTEPGVINLKKNRQGRISSKSTLHQRQVDPKTGSTYEPLLTSIANVLTCGFYVTHHNNPLLIAIALKLAALPQTSFWLSLCPYNEL